MICEHVNVKMRAIVWVDLEGHRVVGLDHLEAALSACCKDCGSAMFAAPAEVECFLGRLPDHSDGGDSAEEDEGGGEPPRRFTFGPGRDKL